MMPSTTTEALLDVNVLIAALFSNHEHHAIARCFVANLDRFYTCPTTQGGFLRFATRQASALPGLSTHKALEALKEFCRIPAHEFFADGLSYTELQAARVAGHKQWTDAYLLELGRSRGTHLASLDKRMKSLRDEPGRGLVILE